MLNVLENIRGPQVAFHWPVTSHSSSKSFNGSESWPLRGVKRTDDVYCYWKLLQQSEQRQLAGLKLKKKPCILPTLYSVHSVFCPPCTLSTPYSAYSVFCPPCTLSTPYSANPVLCPLRILPTLYSAQPVLCPLRILPTLYSVHSVFCLLCILPTLYSVHSVFCPLYILLTLYINLPYDSQNWKRLFPQRASTSSQ